MRLSIRGTVVVLLLWMSTTSSFAQSEKSWEEDSVAVLAQVEEFQLKIDKIRRSAPVLLPVVGASGVVFITHAGVLVVKGLNEDGLFGALAAFDNEIVQIEAAIFYGSGAIAAIQCYRIDIIELRRWLLLKSYNRNRTIPYQYFNNRGFRRYLEHEDKVVPQDS